MVAATVARRLEQIVRLRMEEIPVVLVQGPRSVGKTTMLRSLAASFSVDMVDLDDPATRAVAELDPRILVTGPRPVLIDEYQHVPGLVAAIKNQLNQYGSPGQFVLTGSAVDRGYTAGALAVPDRPALSLAPLPVFPRREIRSPGEPGRPAIHRPRIRVRPLPVRYDP